MRNLTAFGCTTNTGTLLAAFGTAFGGDTGISCAPEGAATAAVRARGAIGTRSETAALESATTAARRGAAAMAQPVEHAPQKEAS